MRVSVQIRKPWRRAPTCSCWDATATQARPGPELAAVDARLGGLLSRVLAAEKFEGKPGQVSYFFTNGKLPAARVMVVGLGPRREAGADAVRNAAATAARRARDLGAATVAMYLRRGGTPGACPRPGHRGRRAAGHVPVRQVPQGEERQGAHRPDRAGAGRPPGRGRPRGRAARRDRRRRHHPRARPRQRARQRGDADLPRRAARARSRGPAVSASACWTARSARSSAWAPFSAWPRAARSRPSSSTSPMRPAAARGARWRSSARASPSTPAASISSPPTGCCA